MRVLWVIAMSARLAVGGDKSSAADVFDAVMVSLATDHDDESLARKLKSFQPVEQVGGIVYFLSNQGVGPGAMAELKRLAIKSASLPAPSPPPVSIQPVPDDSLREQLFQNAVEYASKYIAGLPNFLCDETTRRFADSVARHSPTRNSKELIYRDKFKSVLRFSSGHDNVEVLSDSGGHGPKMLLKPGQSISFGEFGGDLEMVLGSREKAVLAFRRWENFHRKRTAVLGYVVGNENTRFQIAASDPLDPSLVRSVLAPIAGEIYVDARTGAVLRLTIRALKLPDAFEVKESRSLIDYGDISIGGRTYVLPTRAILFMRGDHQRNRNEIAFTNYRRFAAESVLVFDDSKSK